MNRVWEVSQSSSDGALPEWVRSAVKLMAHRIAEPPFPCFYAAHALKHRLVYFSYLEKNEIDVPVTAVEALREFLSVTAGSKSLPVLLLFISLDADDLEDCRRNFWIFLRTVSRQSRIPNRFEPSDPAWTFEFEGEHLFVNAHSRFYVRRRSRWAPSDLMLVIQRLGNVEQLATAGAEVQQISDTIRAKIFAYDNSPVGLVFGRNFMDPNTSYSAQFWIDDA